MIISFGRWKRGASYYCARICADDYAGSHRIFTTPVEKDFSNLVGAYVTVSKGETDININEFKIFALTVANKEFT